MNKTYRNAILCLLFALICVFSFFSINYFNVKVNAIESENVETETPEEEQKPPIIEEENKEENEEIPPIEDNKDEENKPVEEEITGDKYIYKDEKTIQELILSEDFKFKLTITNLENAEITVKKGYFVLTADGYVLKTEDKEQLRVQVDYDKGTFINLETITEDDVLNEVKGLSDDLKDTIMIIVNIFASLGITWASLATILKWFKNKTKDANKGLDRTKDMLDDLKEKLKNNNGELTEIKEKFKQATDEVKELKELVEKYVNNEEFRKDKINEVVKDVLDENGDE